jgi:hypothetical protein
LIVLAAVIAAIASSSDLANCSSILISSLPSIDQKGTS